MVDTIEYEALITGPDAHAGRPTAADVGEGALFSCTDDDQIERSNGTTWDAWFGPY